MNILNSKEEKKLSKKELINYYQNLREYLISTPHENLSNGSLTICPAINGFVKKILKYGCGYEIKTYGAENVKGLTGIYANTHQSKCDHFNFVVSNPNHTIVLNNSEIIPLFKFFIELNGAVFVKRNIPESRFKAKLELMRLLCKEDKSITIFPEGVWNLSPSKLLLPVHAGFVDIAKKTGMPIIPVVHFYDYDNSKQDGIERIKGASVHYCDPIYVSESDNIIEKVQEYSDVVATVKWNMIEKKGIYKRDEISNSEYINFLEGNLRNLKEAGSDINTEQKTIFGYDSEPNLYQHVNAIPYNENGEFISAEKTKYFYKS